jgi:hypothetical protein
MAAAYFFGIENEHNKEPCRLGGEVSSFSVMNEEQKRQIYRDLIDELVRVCKNGQGLIGARRARDGVWNKNATKDFIPEQHEINLLLKRMPPAGREIIAGMLSQAFETGVFETLKVLEQFEIDPLKNGYEGSPFNDFIGRLADWKWPTS